ncbi:hypothetical protein G6F69_006871 [Rhizopus microsporus]|nr:hypothetical protein G6F69_006871 [Rhizopus microsporus]
MSFQIFYEDRHGNAVDEYGRPEPMDYIIDEERYALETVSSKRAYTLYTDQEKVRFFKLVFEKVMSASAAAKQLGIHHKKAGCSRILHEEHKQVILEYIDENPSAVLEQVMKRLLQRFQDLKVSKSTVYNFVRIEYNLSLKNAQPQPVDRNSEEKIQECFDWLPLDRYRLWNRDVAACLNYMHILRGLRRNGMVPDRFRRVAVAPTRLRRRVDDQEQPRTRIRIDSSPS